MINCNFSHFRKSMFIDEFAPWMLIASEMMSCNDGGKLTVPQALTSFSYHQEVF